MLEYLASVLQRPVRINEAGGYEEFEGMWIPIPPEIIDSIMEYAPRAED